MDLKKKKTKIAGSVLCISYLNMSWRRQDIQNRIGHIFSVQLWSFLHLFNEFRVDYKIISLDDFCVYCSWTYTLKLSNSKPLPDGVKLFTVILIFSPRWLSSCLSVSVRAVTAYLLAGYTFNPG
jgi:hypothetical protein